METTIARFSSEPEGNIESPLRLITDRGHFHDQIEGIMREEKVPPNLKAIIDPLMAYLATTSRKPGSSEGCPFTPLVAAQNAYFLSPSDFDPDLGDGTLDDVFRQLLLTHKGLSPTSTAKMDGFDLTVVLKPFTHPNAQGGAFAEALVERHQVQRLSFIKEGLMVAHAGPHHPGGVQSGFAAPTNTLIARRMHRRDKSFMITDEEKAAFEGVYGQVQF